MALLFEKSRYVLGALRTQLLVESGTPDLRCIPFHLNDVASDALGLLGQFQQLWFILFLDSHLVVTEENGDFPQDVVFCQLAKSLVGRRNGCLVRRNFGRVRGTRLLFGLKLLLLLLYLLFLCLYLLLVLLNLLFRRGYTRLNVLGSLEVRAME